VNRDDLRIEELHNLRLALATFALHLDAFEMKVNEATLDLMPAGGFVRADGFVADSRRIAEDGLVFESRVISESRLSSETLARPRAIVDRLQKENRIVRR
jgi:hypothetical protein